MCAPSSTAGSQLSLSWLNPVVLPSLRSEDESGTDSGTQSGAHPHTLRKHRESLNVRSRNSEEAKGGADVGAEYQLDLTQLSWTLSSQC